MIGIILVLKCWVFSFCNLLNIVDENIKVKSEMVNKKVIVDSLRFKINKN